MGNRRKEEEEQLHLFLGICLIALGMSMLGNLIVEYLVK